MSPLFRNPRPTCARCRCTKCSDDVTCNICKDWSVAQWEAFLKRRPYSERRKKLPSGSALPSAPPTILPSASVSSEAGRPVPPPRPPPPPPSEDRGRSGETESGPRVGSPPSRRSVGGGGGATGASASAGDSAASSLMGVGVA